MPFAITRMGPPGPQVSMTTSVLSSPSADPVTAITPVRKLDAEAPSQQQLIQTAARVSISAEAQTLNAAFRATRQTEPGDGSLEKA